jgi:hypothetical protein
MNQAGERTVLTATEFNERVMAAIVLVPTPTPTRTFVAALRARAVRDAVAALWVAWHLGTVRSWHVAPRVRARSFALVLAVTSVLATGGLAAAAAVHSVVPQRDDRNPVSDPSGSSVDAGPDGNGQTGSDGPDESDESPATSHDPGSTDHVGSGATVDTSDDADDGQHPTKGVGQDDADEHDGDHHDGDTADDGDGHDGTDGDTPAATDDHSGSDGGDGPDESDEPDHSSDGGDAPDATDDHSGSSGGDGEPDGASGVEPGGD